MGRHSPCGPQATGGVRHLAPSLQSLPGHGGGGSATWSSVPCFELPQLSLWPRPCRLCGLRLMLRPYLASCVAVAPSWERENLLVTVPFRGAPAQPPVQTFPCTSRGSLKCHFSFLPPGPSHPYPVLPKTREAPGHAQPWGHRPCPAPPGTAVSVAIPKEDSVYIHLLSVPSGPVLFQALYVCSFV